MSKAREIGELAMEGLTGIIQACDGQTMAIAELAEDLKAQIEAATPRRWQALVLPDGRIASVATMASGTAEIITVEEIL